MGLTYIDTKGNERPAKRIREPCSGCIYNCTVNFDTNERTRLHQHYWSLGKEQKKLFFDTFIDRVAKKRCYVKHESRRTWSFIYNFPTLHDVRQQVCKKFFLNTLGIGTGILDWHFNGRKNTN